MGKPSLREKVARMHIESSYGVCQGCGRGYQYLTNGRCEDCHFYGMEETDPEVSSKSTAAVKRGDINAHYSLK